MNHLNEALFLFLNASPQASGLALTLAKIEAIYFIGLVPVLLCAMWLWGYRADRFTAVACFLGLLVALAANYLLGAMHYEPRPFLVGLGTTLIDHRPNSSFPSNHATICFCVAAVFALYRHWRFAVGAALLGVVVAWSRIYVGIHYPLDMLGGALTGILGALLSVEVIMNYWGAPILNGLERVYRALFGVLIRRNWVRG